MTGIMMLLPLIAGNPLISGEMEKSSTLPASLSRWQAEWSNPSADNRPLQIVHSGYRNPATLENMRYYKDQCGLGGIVCNVGPKDYLLNEAEWQRFAGAVRAAREAGLRVWIYDEDGYPSPEAGGVVLRGHPELESQALVYDPEAAEPFAIRPAYEYTHACNNYAAARRYPNPLDPAATQRFLQVTHQAYRDRLGAELFSQIEAFFTDEPSMMAVNIGQIPESVRKNVRIDDPLDPNVKPLPMVSWSADLPEQYEKRYGENLLAVRKSLFTGDSPEDQRVRRQFWSLIGELDAERYYGAIQTWCRNVGSSMPTLAQVQAASDQKQGPLRLAASGHTLHEENILAHVPLDGNKLQALARFDLPGLDMLNSDPRACGWGAWKAAAFPCSAALLTGKRFVMTEVSDFSQLMAEKPQPVTLEMMQATTAWQAAWGVTEMTLYYGISKRGDEAAEATHKKYCEFVGRLNAILREAAPVRPVLLYYPVTDLQSDYRPAAEPISIAAQPKRLQNIVGSFDRLGQLLVTSQIPFVLVDDSFLKQGKITGEKLEIAKSLFDALIVPNNVQLLPDVQQKVDEFVQSGGKVIRETSDSLISSHRELEKRLEAAQLQFARFAPGSEWLTLGRFHRDHCEIFLLLNTGVNPYRGTFHMPLLQGKTCVVLDPASGGMVVAEHQNVTSIPVSLEANQTQLVCIF